MTTIADRLSIAQSRINQAAQNCSRLPSDISLLAVSKTKPINDIIAAYEAGQRQFGENYVQEGETKITALAADYPDIEWHFIGPLQSNKTKIVAEHFDWMHTVSRDKIAQRLNDQRPDSKLPLNVCIQVNISQEDSKSGVDANQVATLALTISQLPNLTLRGLMAIPTATDNTQLQQQEFANLKVLYDQLKLQYPSIDTLSMGMSGDMDIAIANGSTMVRIGSAIFGER
ncbi:YggS family pyridoxal phosphate-dependent enzyme [Shewanella ulleungensis]|jgi:pyridoxal phosphate enzyme (YggS family)|uniref:YggS family pyridoxal phosphate-dependent enzyme n=1 Tax=Shewanella ulleungensis TaxID=2282699 RepID=UPI001666D2B1|nr:YggS family pyridoxal phosphate-dependent enzyme [Shewanella ulleungensis]MCL1149879.1 YggS family pyridoxal phosphate-dependent enzyme [Shewanella ulleungensis]